MPRTIVFLLFATAAGVVNAQAMDQKLALKQAFDGAMTCSAVTAIKADEVPRDESWRWENRSFVFGMLATSFWTQAQGAAMPAKELTKILNDYAGALQELTAEARAQFETNCQPRYADTDKVCQSNPCPHKPPADEGTQSEGAAPG